MYENSTEMKIWRVVSPILLYLFINMMVQVIFTVAVTMVEFFKLNEGGIISYFAGYNFSKDIDRVVGENTLAVTIISSIITVPAGLRMMKKDEDVRYFKPLREHIKDVKLKSWYFAALLGAFAAMGISKLVTLFPIDNILGSYAKVQSDFASNSLILQIIGLVLAAPVVEEIIFRGLVYKRIKGYTESMAGVYISAAVFGIYHFNLVQGIYGFVLGILLCYVYERYKTILAPVILHGAANLTALIMEYGEISAIINENIYLKILFMLIEVGILAALMWRMNNIENINSKNYGIMDIKVRKHAKKHEKGR